MRIFRPGGRRGSRWWSAVVVLALLRAAPAQELPPGWPADPQSTTGPKRPASLADAAAKSVIRRYAITDPVVVSNVPAYYWYHGCGPTAEGMVLGYWHGRGFTDLVAGSATSQTANVDAMIASQGNIDDYCKPYDDLPSPIIDDASSTNPAGCHTDDSIADFFHTSRSAESHNHGWSSWSMAPSGFTGYVRWKVPAYTGTAQGITWSSGLWDQFRAEINSNHPAVLMVDYDGNGSVDHFLTAIGYGTENGTNMYACHDTWDYDVHWYPFQQYGAGRYGGIYGAIFYCMKGTGGVVTLPTKVTHPSPTNNATGVLPGITLSWYYSSGADTYDVYFGTNPTPGAAEFKGSQGATNYWPGTLAYGTRYYWRIDAENVVGTTTGDVWQFLTTTQVIHYVSRFGSNNWPYTTWANAATTILAAVTAAAPGEIVLVTNGTYRQGARIDILQNIRVESVNGPYATTIDGNYLHQCLWLTCGVVRGFTIRNGASAGTAAGVYMMLDGRVENCLIRGNAASGNGGGVYLNMGGEVRNCLIVSNSGVRGGGVYLISGGLVGSSTVSGNTATDRGGGVYISGAGMVRNSILYHNSAPTVNASNFYNSTGSRYTNCCASPAPTMGPPGNIEGPPGFVDYSAGDLHLSSTSVCVNAGTNDLWMSEGRDLDGHPRILRDRVDIGADEYVCVPEATYCAASAACADTTWTAETGSCYRLQSCVNMPGQAWEYVSGVLTADTGTITLSHTNGTSPNTFYRAVLILP